MDVSRTLAAALLRWYVEEGMDHWPLDVTAQDMPQKPAIPRRPALDTAMAPKVGEIMVDAVLQGRHPMSQAGEKKLPVLGEDALGGLSPLEKLRQDMENFKACPLALTAQNMVFAHGDAQSEIMIIGEAPGAEEDAQGKPFVGMSGKLLNHMLASIGIDRHKVYITNVVPWRPPLNRQPTAEEIGLCLPFLQRHIACVAPKVLMLMGAVACKALLKTSQAMGELCQTAVAYTSPSGGPAITAWPFYHPAYLLRSPGQKKKAWRQLLALKNFLRIHGKEKL